MSSQVGLQSHFYKLSILLKTMAHRHVSTRRASCSLRPRTEVGPAGKAAYNLVTPSEQASWYVSRQQAWLKCMTGVTGQLRTGPSSIHHQPTNQSLLVMALQAVLRFTPRFASSASLSGPSKTIGRMCYSDSSKTLTPVDRTTEVEPTATRPEGLSIPAGMTSGAPGEHSNPKFISG